MGKANKKAQSLTLAEMENAFAFLEWFFANADFGPADADVRGLMLEQYEEETGNSVPEEYK